MARLYILLLVAGAVSCAHPKGDYSGLVPAEALRSFELPEGFQIELIASEPLVADPVAMEVDEQGNFYVVEMHGYPENLKSSGVVKLLKALPRFEGSPYVFPSARGGPLSDGALARLLERMGVSVVPHGFRSTFRDWCAERTAYPREVAEMADRKSTRLNSSHRT